MAVALLDVLSGGRVNWGAGRGFDRREFDNFGVTPEESAERFREAVEIVLAAWRSERLSYQGSFHRYEDVEVLPKPLQQPHPPVWVAASSDSAIEWAAQQGHSILMDPHAAHVEIGRKRLLYRERLAAHGHSDAGREIPMARLLAVAPTEERIADVRAALPRVVRALHRAGAAEAALRGQRTETGLACPQDALSHLPRPISSARAAAATA